MVFTGILFLLTLVAMLVQDFMPAISWAYEARFLIVPMLFFAISVAVPFPLMLCFALVTGFLWDARHLVIAGPTLTTGQPMDLDFGYSIVLYGLMGSLMQGIRPMFRQGRWELPILMSGVATFLLLVLEYLLINFQRGEFLFPKSVWYLSATSAIFAMLLSPLFFLFVYWLARRTGYRIRFEGLVEKRKD